jgi:hypothetical protein
MVSFFKGPTAELQKDAFALTLAGLARLAKSCETIDPEVRERLQSIAAQFTGNKSTLTNTFLDYMRHPIKADEALAKTAMLFQLETVETFAICLAIAAEQDLSTGHLLAHLQQPLAQSRPTIGLIAQAYEPEDPHSAVHVLGQGNAIRCGLFEFCGEDNPLPERQIRVPIATALALQNIETSWPGTSSVPPNQADMPLGRTSNEHAKALAARLLTSADESPALIIRCGDTAEARAAAAQVCELANAQAVLIRTDQLMGMAPWLVLRSFIPVFDLWLAPGERKTVPQIPGYVGPIIALSGPEGDFESDSGAVFDWRITTPPSRERIELWTMATGDPDLAERLGKDHRHSAGRIAALADKAREDWSVSSPGNDNSAFSFEHIRAVSRRGDATGLGAFAELIPDEVGDDALILTAALRKELESLVTRCRLREQFSESLGPSIQARYRPAVRALFVGPSGTGKTLAVGWLASQLGIPLFRVDLAAVTSKYVGEAEKNLSQLLARAEQNEVLLLFDEADSLFGKRTDIRDANDRFANAQTNYLLQRMESYEGITILTSNGRSRFDDAFSRRFDAILSFPLPGPEERRALWNSHLGTKHDVTPAQLNLLAAYAELTGGQIRNAVLRAAVDAVGNENGIEYANLLEGIATEYRKLSRQLPNELKHAQVAATTALHR